MELLIEFALNCFFYGDDYISEKYHNNGRLKTSTSLLISTISNILSSLITYIVKKLTNYDEILEFAEKDVMEKEKYLYVMFKYIKRTRVLLGIFFSMQLILNIMMSYYSIIFCIVYRNTQVSVFTNYLVGTVESLLLSFSYSLLFSCIRYFSLKLRSKTLYNTSKYLLDHF